MSEPQATTPYNPWHGLLHAVAERLIPLFQVPGQSRDYARRAAREAIAAYRAESRADYASIGRILALSLAAVAAIGQSANPDLPAALQLCLLTNANSLSRSADLAERAMINRRQRRDSLPETGDYLLAPPDQEAPAPEAAIPVALTPEAPMPVISMPVASAPAASPPVAPMPAAAMPGTSTPVVQTADTAAPEMPTFKGEAILAQIDTALAEFRTLPPQTSVPAPNAAAPPEAPSGAR